MLVKRQSYGHCREVVRIILAPRIASPNLLPRRVVASSQTLLARDPDPGGVLQGGATAIGSGHTLPQLIHPSLQ